MTISKKYQTAQLFSTFIIIDYNNTFFKDHVILKTGIISSENSALPSQE